MGRTDRRAKQARQSDETEAPSTPPREGARSMRVGTGQQGARRRAPVTLQERQRQEIPDGAVLASDVLCGCEKDSAPLLSSCGVTACIRQVRFRHVYSQSRRHETLLNPTSALCLAITFAVSTRTAKRCAFA